MPTYSMRNKDTGEVFTVTLKMAEREEYLNNNPHLEQILTNFPGVCDSIRLGITKPPDSFNDILKHAKKSHLHSTIRAR